MKKLICIVLCVVMVMTLAGCNARVNKQSSDQIETYSRIICIYNDGFCQVFVDTETGVQYFARANAGLTILLNPDGTPYTG